MEIKNQKFLLDFEQLIGYIVYELEQVKDSSLDFDFNEEVLSIDAPEGFFIINRQIFLQEIWLSSPISGPYHFKLEGDTFTTSKGTLLFPLLSKELGISFDSKSFSTFLKKEH